MRINKVLICFIGILIITFSISQTSAAENTDIFNNILVQTNAITTEIGINADYEISTGGIEESKNWLKSLNLYDEKTIDKTRTSNNYGYLDLLKTASDVNVKKQITQSKNNTITLENCITINKDKVYCREFQKGNIYGYIESRENGNGSKISIFMRELLPKENVNDIEAKVKNAIGKKAIDINIYKYLKAKTSIKSAKLIQNRTTEYLKDIGTENISTVNINEGYSTVAYTKKFMKISDNGKYEDFNYAVLNQSDQNYIILGTPIIDISY